MENNHEKVLHIENHQISPTFIFPMHLEELSLEYCTIPELPVLPASLRVLRCERCKIDKIIELPPNLEEFYFYVMI